jgi:hypothetical protein
MGSILPGQKTGLDLSKVWLVCLHLFLSPVRLHPPTSQVLFHLGLVPVS